MFRIIEILLITSAFITTVYSGNVLKCYMCTSLSDEGCGSNVTTKLQPECTDTNIDDFQRKIQQHKVLTSLASVKSFFKDDEVLQQYQSSFQNMSCAKVILNIKEQDVIIRICQKTKTEHIDPCKSMEDELNGFEGIKMEQCALCYKDACNSTMFVSSEIFYIFLSFFCTFIIFYR